MPGRDETDLLVEHLFRHEAGRIVALLTRICGVENMDLAEDAVHEALLKALQTWPYAGIPSNPPGWLMQVARNSALDRIRREAVLKTKQDVFALEIIAETDDVRDPDRDAIEDDMLSMMFVCCHPSLPVESQIALTLRTLCGFSIAEIARAFLTNVEAIHKRLVRARQTLQFEHVSFEAPDASSLSARLDTVLHILYLLFNEGYNAHEGEDLIRRELCEEAVHLAGVLTHHPHGDVPKAHALLALMLLHSARFPARVDEHGNLLLLQDQDRSLWSRQLIIAGLYELGLSGEGEEISEYHLQAGIAACHCNAKSYDRTDWAQILMLYDMLVELNASPIIALNRAVALAHVQGPAAGIQEAERIAALHPMNMYYLLHAVLGELHEEAEHRSTARVHFEKALSLTKLPCEQRFLQRKLDLLSGPHDGH